MRYKYTYRTTARDLWQLSMYYIYGSLAGLCNIIFTVAAFALGFSRWDQAQGIVRCLIVLGCCLFTVIQPLMIYAKAKKQAAGITQDTQVSIDDNGLYIRVGVEVGKKDIQETCHDYHIQRYHPWIYIYKPCAWR